MNRYIVFMLSAMCALGFVHTASANCNSNTTPCFSEYNGASNGIAIQGLQPTGISLWGETTSNGIGVYGATDGTGTGYGVEGVSYGTGVAVYGVNYGTGYAIHGVGDNNDAVHGDGVTGYSAVAGWNSGSGNGVWGGSNTGYAGNFTGGTGKVDATSYYVAGSCVFGCTSDLRLKQNVRPMNNALNTLLQLHGVTFQWQYPSQQGENQDRMQRGFIAQEVQASFPEWVSNNAEGFKTLNIPQAQIEALEVESIRSLKQQNDDLQTRLDALEGSRKVSWLSNVNAVSFSFVGLALVTGAVLVSRRKNNSK